MSKSIYTLLYLVPQVNKISTEEEEAHLFTENRM